MVTCDYCKKEIKGIPYKCDLCKGIYCKEHRLPPNHECEEIPTWTKNPNQEKILKNNWNTKQNNKTNKNTIKTNKKSKNLKKLTKITILILILITGFGIALSQQMSSNITPPEIFQGETVQKSVKLNPTINPITNKSNQNKYPLKNLNYYYKVSEEVTITNFDIPQQKNIEGLNNLLNQIVLRKYEKQSIFTCSESTSILEWILEGSGFNTKIATNQDLSKIPKENKEYHSWLIVQLENGDQVAIETTYLTKNNYHPPGIIETKNGKYRKYSTKWRMYQKWKKNNYEITYNKWKEKYQVDKIIWDPNYYNPQEIKENPQEYIEGETINNTKYYVSRNNFDWWNADPYNQSKNEYSNWN